MYCRLESHIDSLVLSSAASVRAILAIASYCGFQGLIDAHLVGVLTAAAQSPTTTKYKVYSKTRHREQKDRSR